MERKIAPAEDKDPAGFVEVDEQLNAELQVIVEKYNLSTLVAGVSYLANPQETVDEDPETHDCTFAYKVFVNEGLLNTAKKKIATLNIEELTPKEQAQTYVCLKHTASLYNLLYALMSNEEPDLKQLVTKLSEKLGYSKSRLVAVAVNTKYLIVCEKVRYEVSYDNDFVFTVTEFGKRTEKFLVFMGNVQSDGTIFHAFEIPVFSTGDRLLFGRRDAKFAGKAIPEMITEPVLDIIPVHEVN